MFYSILFGNQNTHGDLTNSSRTELDLCLGPYGFYTNH